MINTRHLNPEITSPVPVRNGWVDFTTRHTDRLLKKSDCPYVHISYAEKSGDDQYDRIEDKNISCTIQYAHINSCKLSCNDQYDRTEHSIKPGYYQYDRITLQNIS